MKILFSDLPKYPWWGSGTPAYENNWAMEVGKIPDQELVLKEYAGVKEMLLAQTELEVIPFPEDLDANGLNKHDAIFLRDSFISNQQGGIVLSRFAEKERQAETDRIEAYAKNNGYKIYSLSEDAYAEGGEFFFSKEDGMLFAGISRNNKMGIAETAKFLQAKALCIIESDSFHLDTVFSSMLDKKGKTVGMIVSLSLVKNASEIKEFATKYNLRLLDIHPADAINFDGNGNIAVNTLPTPGKLLGGSKFYTPGIEEEIAKMGIEHVVAPITQFLMSGGGVHCLTNELFFQS